MVYDFKKLEIWQLSHELTLEIYQITTTFPDSEKFGLVSQMRRASSSIPANIAEGCWKHTNADFVNFLYVARGSLSEIIYFLILAKDLKYIEERKFGELENQNVRLSKMLNSFISTIKQNSHNVRYH